MARRKRHEHQLGDLWLGKRPDRENWYIMWADRKSGRVERLSTGTEDLDEAEDYILGEFGWPIRVPVLAGSRLVGVGVDEIAEGVELPVLQYATGESEPITVYVFDYAFLDAAAGRLSLAPAVYARVAEDEGVDVRCVEGGYIILWRRRVVIYPAVMLEDPSPIAEGLRRGR